MLSQTVLRTLGTLFMLGEYSASTANPSQIRTSSNPAQGMIACQKLKQKKKRKSDKRVFLLLSLSPGSMRRMRVFYM